MTLDLATAIRIGLRCGCRCTRRLLKTSEKAKGTRGQGRPKIGGTKSEPPKTDTPTLSSLGITKHESSHAQAVAELDLKERQGTLADVTKLKAGLSMLCLAIRSATRTLETQFGREAAGIIDEAISDFETQAAAAFPTEVAE